MNESVVLNEVKGMFEKNRDCQKLYLASDGKVFVFRNSAQGHAQELKRKEVFRITRDGFRSEISEAARVIAKEPERQDAVKRESFDDLLNRVKYVLLNNNLSEVLMTSDWSLFISSPDAEGHARALSDRTVYRITREGCNREVKKIYNIK